MGAERKVDPRAPEEGSHSEESKDREVQLHAAEYAALMARATSYIVIKTSIWPLMVIYLALVAQLCRPDNIALDVAFQNLLNHPFQRALILWGNLSVLLIMLKAFSQLTVDQYEITLYIEKELRMLAAKANPKTFFWGYEEFRTRKTLKSGADHWGAAAFLVFFAALVGITLIVWPVSKYDLAGATLNIAILLLFLQDTRTVKKLRKEWHELLAVHSKSPK